MKKNKDQIYKQRLRKLIKAGVSLSSEKEIRRLLQKILEFSHEISPSQSIQFFLVKEKSSYQMTNVVSLQKQPHLYFLKSHDCLQGLGDHNQELQINHDSVAGYVASQKDFFLYKESDQKKSLPCQLDSLTTVDGKVAKSILCLPVIAGDGKVRGALLLMNKISEQGLTKLKKTGKIPSKNLVGFNKMDVELMQIFASYAAIALENAQLTESIENLFESFVRASVKAIEARDPTTSGHSDRVAMMTVELALATHKIGEGPFKDVSFSEDQLKEIRYASLLHDFGKIGVTEPVLLKKKKLKDRELESILLRFDTLASTNETKIWKKLCDRFVHDKQQANSEDLETCYQQARSEIEMLKARVRKLRSQVITANEPQVMSDDFNIDDLIEKITQTNQYFNGSVLTQSEINSLAIPRGSLTPTERQEIESHVSHTYNFLKQIAWTDNLSHVTAIAHAHHEKVDGSGYPRGIIGEQIPIQSRMMTIADIYDALTAFDRPYKKSLPPAKALEILIKEARNQKIDGYLLKIFIEAGVFHHATLGTHKKAS